MSFAHTKRQGRAHLLELCCARRLLRVEPQQSSAHLLCHAQRPTRFERGAHGCVRARVASMRRRGVALVNAGSPPLGPGAQLPQSITPLLRCGASVSVSAAAAASLRLRMGVSATHLRH